jgi:hypothetical protein
MHDPGLKRSHRSGLLAGRLSQLGFHPGQARSTALFQLATELPSALLARMLGIHIAVAVAWQRPLAQERWTSAAGHRDTRIGEASSWWSSTSV